MVTTARLTNEEIAGASPDYLDRLATLRNRLDELPFGAQQTASYDLRIAPSIVSNVVNGRTVRDDVLARLEAWADEATPLSVAAARDTTLGRHATVDEFAADRLVSDARAMTPIGELAEAYQAWLGDRVGLSRWPLVAELRKRWPTVRAAGGTVFAGVRLRKAGE